MHQHRTHLLLITDRAFSPGWLLDAIRSVLPEVYLQQIDSVAQFANAFPQGVPDAVILDCQPDAGRSLEALRTIKQQRPELPVLMLIPVEREELVPDAVAAGLDEYLLKTPRVHVRLPAALSAVLERAAQRRLLEDVRQRYQRLFNDGPAGQFRCTADGRLVAANSALSEILGERGADRLLGRRLVDFFQDAGDWPRSQGATSAPTQQDVRLRRRDGSVAWARIRVRVVEAHGTEDPYLEGSIEDITEQRQAQQDLQASEEKLRLIFEHAFDGISIYEELPETGSRRLLDCNDRYAEMAGRSKEELLSIGNTSVLQCKVSRKFSRAENLLIRQQKVRYRGLFSWVRPDGKENIIEYSAAPIDADGRPLTIGIDRDITDHIRSQEEAQRRAAHLEALNEIIRAGAAARNPRELLEQAINQLCTGLQADRAVLWVGNDVVFHGLDERQANRWRIHAEVNWRTNRRAHVQQWNGAAQGDMLLVAPIRHEETSLGGFVISAVDVDAWPDDVLALADGVAREIGAAVERLRLLERVQTQIQQMQMLVDSTPDGILLLNQHRRVVLMNPAAQETLQPLGPVLLGQCLATLGPLSVDDLLTSDAGRPHEIRADDHALILEVSANPVASQGNTHGWLLVVRNTTQEWERQQHTEQRNRLAAVGQLAAGIAHDFNNVLAAILLLEQMLEEEKNISDRGRARLHTIKEQTQHAAELIRQILDFSRKSVIKRRVGDLASLVRETAELLRHTLGDNIRILVACPEQECPVDADFTRLKQVLMNLAVNARDAMPNGGSFSLDLAPLQVEPGDELAASGLAPGNWFQLTVSDTGWGMPPDILPHIFEPFFTTKQVGQGTGLGLSQVYGIVKQHGGEILVESRPRKGSRFRIFLPAVEAQEPEALQAAPAVEDNRAQYTLLIVEDNVHLLEALCEVISMHGHRTLAANSGEAALDLFEQEGPDIDLVISDMSMPGMSGIELHHALRARRPDIRTIILSGYPAERERYEWRQVGIIDWLQKPISSDNLMTKIREALSTTRDEKG
jgi:PAS domain S-box-containing protein